MSRRLLSAAVVWCAAACAIAGCGLGPGPSHGGATVLVTRDFGTVTLGQASSSSAPSSETAMRMLERSFTVTTRYGGGFVQSINGLAGGHERGRPVDWFIYVNGIESAKGAAEVKVNPSDKIWWDRHDWSATLTIPAVIGSFPEPFLHGTMGKRLPVRVDCAPGVEAACQQVSQRFSAAGVVAANAALGMPSGRDVARVLVGPWSAVSADGAARQIGDGPAASGVYVRIDSAGKQLSLLDPAARVVQTLGPGAGLVAATRYRDQAPTWVVTGTDANGVATAAAALTTQALANHFALAFDAGKPIPIPVVGK